MSTLAKYSAKMFQPLVAWRLRNTELIVVGPTPRLVLALKARRDVELLTLLVEFPELATVPGSAVSLLAEVPHAVGLRRLQPEGEPWVAGQENVDASDMTPAAPGQYRWHGDLVYGLETNHCQHPHDYWAFAGKIIVPKYKSLGVIVQASRQTLCRIKMAGV